MLVGADEIFRAAMDICEIATAAAGDQDFLPDTIGAFEDGDAAAAFAGFGGAEESCGTSAENQYIKLTHPMNLPLYENRGRKLSLPSFLRVN